MAKNDITAVHPAYHEAFPDWELVADACEGERVIKSKGDRYLPRPNASDRSPENLARYEQYKQRATWYGATGWTLQGLSGIAFRKWPEIELPKKLEAFQNDVTGGGITLVQHSQMTLTEVLKSARAGILVDYPPLQQQASRADEEAGIAQPTFALYSAVQITNWEFGKIGRRAVPTWIVLRESYEERDQFEVTIKTQYRELAIENGEYIQRIWRKKGKGKNAEWVVDTTYAPKRGNGQPWREIPFTFVGAMSNDGSIQTPPLLAIANLNVAHYRNSADFEESVYMLGQGQAWMSGLTHDWVEMLEKKGIYFGSRSILPLPENGQAGLLQMHENTLARGAMEQKEHQMAALGARLLTRGAAGAVQKTKAEVDSDDATAHSVLSLCCDNVSAGYTQALKWAADFANTDGEVVFSIGTEFVTDQIDAQMMTALLQGVIAGKIPLSDFWSKLRSAGYIDSQKSDEEIQEELDATALDATGGALRGIEDEDEPAAARETEDA